MQYPPDLQLATARATTNAAPNTENTTTLVTAPGAGQRIRVWAAALAASQNDTGVVLTYLCQGTNTAPLLPMLSRPASGTSGYVFVPGGWALDSNTLLAVRDRSDAASQGYFLSVYYTVEGTV